MAPRKQLRDLGMKASVDFSLLQNTMSGLRKASGIVDPAPSSNDNNATITATTNASTSSLKPVDRAKSYHGRVSTSAFGGSGGSGGGNKLGAAADAGSSKVRPKSAIAGLSNSQVFAADDTPDDQLEKVRVRQSIPPAFGLSRRPCYGWRWGVHLPRGR